jgi:carboxymethylenebutenolidase
MNRAFFQRVFGNQEVRMGRPERSFLRAFVALPADLLSGRIGFGSGSNNSAGAAFGAGLALLLCFFHPGLLAQTAETVVGAEKKELKAGRALSELPGVLINLADFGSNDMAYLSLPAEAPKGGVVLVHDRWGLEETIREFAGRFARAGFVALAVDLFNGQTAADAQTAEDLVASLGAESARTTLEAAVRFLRESPRFHVDHVGMVGWGSGANLLLELASQLRDVEAFVLFYPDRIREGKFEEPRVPVCAIFGSADTTIPAKAVGQFVEELRKTQKASRALFFPGGHGFADPKNPNWKPGSTEQALQAAQRFLQEQYSRGKRKEGGFWNKLFGKG